MGVCFLVLYVEKKSSKIVGYGGIFVFLDGYEIDYIFSKEYRDRGYATKIAKVQINFIKSILNINNIYCIGAS